MGEEGAEAFVRKVHRSMQRTCPGVRKEISTGFAANFYAASVVIRAGTLLGVPEEDGRVIRSLSCLGVKGKEKVCRHCHALSTTISKVMHDHGQRDSLAPISDFQRESLKEERHERRQRQMIPLTDKVFWPATQMKAFTCSCMFCTCKFVFLHAQDVFWCYFLYVQRKKKR